MAINKTVLSLGESERLQECESVIEKNLQTFVEVGNALLEIREARLYRAEFSTFEEYCRERWKIAHNYANKLIRAAEVVSNLGTTVPIPTSESQVRPLTKLELEEQREVWKIATAIHPNPTTEVVERVADTITRAYRDSREEARRYNEARTPVPGKPNPKFDGRWTKLVGGIDEIVAIEPFDAKEIAQQEFRVSYPQNLAERRDECKIALRRITDFLREINQPQ